MEGITTGQRQNQGKDNSCCRKTKHSRTQCGASSIVSVLSNMTFMKRIWTAVQKKISGSFRGFIIPAVNVRLFFFNQNSVHQLRIRQNLAVDLHDGKYAKISTLEVLNFYFPCLLRNCGCSFSSLREKEDNRRMVQVMKFPCEHLCIIYHGSQHFSAAADKAKWPFLHRS